jgi:hypothetical protein
VLLVRAYRPAAPRMDRYSQMRPGPVLANLRTMRGSGSTGSHVQGMRPKALRSLPRFTPRVGLRVPKQARSCSTLGGNQKRRQCGKQQADLAAQVPRLKHSVALYANITNILWDYDAPSVKGSVCVSGASICRAAQPPAAVREGCPLRRQRSRLSVRLQFWRAETSKINHFDFASESQNTLVVANHLWSGQVSKAEWYRIQW